MKIYVASSWRNFHQPAIVQVLRSMGHEVYDFRNPEPGNDGFQWSQIDPDWQQWTPAEYVKALEHPIAKEGFKLDWGGMEWADICVLVRPCGASSHTEAGYMKGQGKKVYVIQLDHQEPELMYCIFDGIITSVNDIQKYFKNRTRRVKEK